MQQVTVAGRYRLVELVGTGGMGRVWRARDEVLHREVAVKEVVPPRWLAESERDELRLRALREARTAARLNHPNVVRLYDVIRVDDQPWIVMEYVPSRSLQTVLDTTGPLDPVRAAEIGLALLAALRAAHAAGVLHRDVKPQNVLVADDGRVMLTDFGLAVFDGGDGLMTRPGMVLGSPQFVAPERAAEGVSSVEADLWSLGATLHAAVEGRSPYARSTAMATLAALASGPPDPAPHAGPLEPVLAGLLCREPGRRIGHDEAARRLTAVARPAPDTDPPTVLLSVPPPPRWPGAPAPADRSPGAGAVSPLSGPANRPDGAGTADPRWAGHAPAAPASMPGLANARSAAGSATTAGPAGLANATSAAGVAMTAGTAGAGAGGVGTIRATVRRWALVGLALLVAAAAGVGTALAVTDERPAATAGAAEAEPWEQADRHEPDRDRPPPPEGGRPMTPPPFPCLRPDPAGEPVAAAPATNDDGFRPPPGWTWYAGTGYRLAVPVGWLRFREDEVDCFRDPASRLTLTVEPAAVGGDPTGYLRAEEQRQRAAGTLPEYRELALGPAGAGGVRWECSWLTPFGERDRALRLLPGGDLGDLLIGWTTADAQWAATTDRLAVVRESLRGPDPERVGPS
ncbi:serine/threonine-protein kinase [Micromonospora sp. NPDC000089]|uniref:serine/threonine-protein kinase n=1 Tax=unclassified Micromonospora TaxID=2617518 RepID=UPI0036C66165